MLSGLKNQIETQLKTKFKVCVCVCEGGGVIFLVSVENCCLLSDTKYDCYIKGQNYAANEANSQIWSKFSDPSMYITGENNSDTELDEIEP